MATEWHWRVLEIRKDPSTASPEELTKLGAQNPNITIEEIRQLTDDWFLGLLEPAFGFTNLSNALTAKPET